MRKWFMAKTSGFKGSYFVLLLYRQAEDVGPGGVPAAGRAEHMSRSQSRSLPVQAFEVHHDQLGQIAAIAAFQQAKGSYAAVSHAFPEPVEILRFKRFVAERIATVGIKATTPR